MSSLIIAGFFIWIFVIPFIVAHKLDKTNPSGIDITFYNLYFKVNDNYTMLYHFLKILVLFTSFIWWILYKSIVSIIKSLFIKKN